MKLPEQLPVSKPAGIVDPDSEKERARYFQQIVEDSKAESVKMSSGKETHLHRIFVT